MTEWQFISRLEPWPETLAPTLPTKEAVNGDDNRGGEVDG